MKDAIRLTLTVVEVMVNGKKVVYELNQKSGIEMNS
ncbi:hypothetical protein SAMN05421676_102439 [Salinibacillus kushneri]|uniref:Uncharacterized protein n=1 Tax=Salinibacillus kushneri TaxID=237682 RepID=A0A1I0BFR2_9BACI|nr:hypothetical protein SAMN05421676_102439 [Salinibacillus kushneri]